MSYVAALHLYRIKLGTKLIRSLRPPRPGQGRGYHKGRGYNNTARHKTQPPIDPRNALAPRPQHFPATHSPYQPLQSSGNTPRWRGSTATAFPNHKIVPIPPHNTPPLGQPGADPRHDCCPTRYQDHVAHAKARKVTLRNGPYATTTTTLIGSHTFCDTRPSGRPQTDASGPA